MGNIDDIIVGKSAVIEELKNLSMRSPKRQQPF